MQSKVEPTDVERELAKGRVALWLDPEDLRWLSRHCCCSKEASREVTDRCARVRFRARAALHKSGMANDHGAETIDRASEHIRELPKGDPL